MANVGDSINTNELGNKVFFNAAGQIVKLAPFCLLMTYEVVAVDQNGDPTILKKVGSSGSGTTTPPTTPTVPANAWLDNNNLPMLDNASKYMLS